MWQGYKVTWPIPIVDSDHDIYNQLDVLDCTVSICMLKVAGDRRIANPRNNYNPLMNVDYHSYHAYSDVYVSLDLDVC